MTDYSELVKALRYHTNPDVEDCDGCSYMPFLEMYGKCTDMMIDNAAAAIEALQAELVEAEARVKELTNECKQLMDDRPVLDSVQGKYVWACSKCGTEIRLYGEREVQE